MKEYIREYPLFSLCGLNCGLCPRYHTDGPSKCPGCGGPDFHIKHPSCAVITCNKKHENVEYCFQCASYPCEKYSGNHVIDPLDSFISYKNVITDFEKAAKEGIENYKIELDEKVNILKLLIDNYNDGRKKSFYCNAVNLLAMEDLREIMEKIRCELMENADSKEIDRREKVKLVVSLLEGKADEKNIALDLRKCRANA